MGQINTKRQLIIGAIIFFAAFFVLYNWNAISSYYNFKFKTIDFKEGDKVYLSSGGFDTLKARDSFRVWKLVRPISSADIDVMITLTESAREEMKKKVNTMAESFVIYSPSKLTLNSINQNRDRLLGTFVEKWLINANYLDLGKRLGIYYGIKPYKKAFITDTLENPGLMPEGYISEDNGLIYVPAEMVSKTNDGK